MMDPGLTVQGEADGRKGSYCTEHLSSHQDKKKKKKGVLEAMSSSGQSPGGGHNEQGMPQNNCHSDFRR